MKKKINNYWMYNKYSVVNAILNPKENYRNLNRKKTRDFLQRVIAKVQYSQKKN